MRGIGFIFLLIGSLPFAALLAYWVWARHVYTVGLAVDPHALWVLASLMLADLLLVIAGVYLLRKTAGSPSADDLIMF
jgi:hypothetical protein